MRELSDDELRDELGDIDKNEDVTVSQFEAEFLESVLYKYTGPLSDKQRAVAQKIIKRYGS